MKRTLLFLSIGTALLLGAVSLWPVQSVFAATLPPLDLAADTAKNDVCAGIGLVGGGCGDNGAQVNSAIAVAINLLSVAVGIVAVVMVIVAGLKFVTSGGDANKVAGAKNAIIYAIIGLVVVATAQMLVHFVFNQVK